MFNFFGDFEIYNVDFEIYIEDKLVQKQSSKAPKEMLMATFIQTVQQIAQDKRAMHLKMIRPEIIWDDIENKQKILNNEVCFSNNAMIAWQESK